MDGLAKLRGKCAPVPPFFRQQRFLLLPSDTPSVLNLRTFDQRGTWHSLRLCRNGTYPNSSQAYTISRGHDEKRRKLLTSDDVPPPHAPAMLMLWRTAQNVREYPVKVPEMGK